MIEFFQKIEKKIENNFSVFFDFLDIFVTKNILDQFVIAFKKKWKMLKLFFSIYVFLKISVPGENVFWKQVI